MSTYHFSAGTTSTTTGAYLVWPTMQPPCRSCSARDAAYKRLWTAFLILCGQVGALLVGLAAVVLGG